MPGAPADGPADAAKRAQGRGTGLAVAALLSPEISKTAAIREPSLPRRTKRCRYLPDQLEWLGESSALRKREREREEAKLAFRW